MHFLIPFGLLLQPPVDYRVQDQIEIERWADMIQVEQVYLLKRVGCYRMNTDPNVITRELTKDDCGKPKGIDFDALTKSKKLAMEIFGLKEK